MTDFGLDHSFATAVQKMDEHYGVKFPVSSLRQYVEANAQRIAEASSSAEEDRANQLPAQGVEQIVAETDGSFVPVVGFEGKSSDKRKNRTVDYREVRLCATQAVGQTQTVYRAALDCPDEIGLIWNRCAKESGRGLTTFVHAVGDGASWIEQQAETTLKADRMLIDFYHVCEYLKKAESECAQNSYWFTTQKNRLKRNRADLVIQELGRHLKAESKPDEDCPVHCAHRYLSNREDHLDYQASLKEALPIGSGLIESGHKHVIQSRLKIAGAAWSEEHADNLIQTRARRASGHWQCFWQN